MYLIAITGAIATGKSTILEHLAEMGFATIDADKVAHQILESDDDLWAFLVTHFGDSILDPDGSICRSCLARIVFGDEVALQKLENEIHPKVRQSILQQLETMTRKEADEVVFLEVALLDRLGLKEQIDEVWVVESPPAIQQQRLESGRHFSTEESKVRISASPLPDTSSWPNVRFVDNSQSMQYTLSRVSELLQPIPRVPKS